jgi:hypothetical protein
MGPNFVDCKNGEKLEKVRIINRTNNTYEVGTTVKLTNIDGFWCAEPYAGETRPKAPRFGEWSFAKLIANSDVYFKDNDYYTTGSKSRSVKDYEAQARSKFYYNQTYELIRNKDRGANEEVISQIRSNGNYNITDGLVDSNFFPANRYYISTVYDQLAEEYGGWSKVSVIGRTNMKLAERGNDVFFDQDCPFFWGPLFSNGYSYITFNEEYSAPDYIQEVTNPQLPMRGTEPDERLDPNHLPAETVSNILDFENIIYNYNQLGLVPISGVLTNKLLKPTYYGSTPIGLNSLQFVPLTFEFVGHNDIWSQARFLSDNANSARKIYESIDKYFQDLYSIDPSNRSTVGYFGNMFDRLGDRGKYIPVVDKISDVDAGFIFTGYCQQLYYKAYEGNPPSNVNSIAYDCYIRREPTSTPLGAPDYFNDTGEYLGANCVGIISAHNKITKKGGGDINIAVAHINIGLASNKQATGGGSLFSNFFDGMFLNMINTGAAARNVERAMWGSTSDNIDSFGTTALHIRIFDSWPEELTIFDPRYFAVLHFNPGDLYSIEGESSVDFASIDLAVGSIVEPRQEIPQIKNTIRRGQLLSNGGFKYKYKTLGLHPTLNQIAGTNNGSGFASGDTIKTGLPGEDGNPSVEITITTVNEEGGITGYTVTNPGVNYTVESFVRTDSTAENPTPIDVVPITLKSPAEGGRSAVIWFLNLIVVEIEKIDEGPKEHTPGPLRLTYASNGAGYINKTKETTINLPSNSTGQYDTYFHFHNDITHTAMLEHGSSQVIGFGQYLDMTIT